MTEPPAAALCEDLLARGIVGAALAVVEGDHLVVDVTRGLADRVRGRPLEPAHRFRIASITKTYVAALALLLDQEGVLDIDAPLARWLPEIDHAGRITLRSVLTHTAGLPLYTHYRLDEFPAPDSRWTPEALVRLAYRRTPARPPGGPFVYANVGSKVVALVIERASGQPIERLMRERLLDPLGLAATVPSGAGLPLPANLARGYDHTEDVAAPVDVTARVPPSFLWAGGDMYATAGDVAHWVAALLGGRVLGPALTRELVRDRVPGRLAGSSMSHHGLGVMAFTRGARQVFGYRGSTPGYVSIAACDPARAVAVAVLTNSYAADATSGFRAHVEDALFGAFEQL